MAEKPFDRNNDDDRDLAEDAPPVGESSKEHDDHIADEWGDESFPSSDPPAHY